LSRAEADLVPASAGWPRHGHRPARQRPPGVRCLALERVLDTARVGDRLQARGVPTRTARVVETAAGPRRHRNVRAGVAGRAAAAIGVVRGGPADSPRARPPDPARFAPAQRGTGAMSPFSPKRAAALIAALALPAVLAAQPIV